MITIGGSEYPNEEIARLVEDYIDGNVAEYAHRSCDAYQTTDDSDRLVDGAFLAPGLLGVPVCGEAFVHLTDSRHRHEELLHPLPRNVHLVNADDSLLNVIGHPFKLIDEGFVRGTGGVILSKILHRKRPKLLPIYDSRVWNIYRPQTGHDPHRPWPEFMTTLARAIRADLQSASRSWSEWGPEVTPLRALDMAVWQLRRTP
jgi:hypothetical protein